MASEVEETIERLDKSIHDLEKLIAGLDKSNPLYEWFLGRLAGMEYTTECIRHALMGIDYVSVKELPIIEALKSGYNYEAYKAYLLTDCWDSKRHRTFERDKYTCIECGSIEHLDCHHLTYKNLGHEPLEDLITLCRSCHKLKHPDKD
jgi:hypothetical protein